MAGATFGEVGLSVFDVGMSIFVAGAHLVMLECYSSWQAHHLVKFW